ncbi:ferredoxin--NADP reductase 1 [Paraliobacillus quinghaiensis]|uniref:Ferredoxin--NADP reductase n=1 Tax=Paraliobacillus quinghaiensis TaxID=470815 RepID=A0A917WY19_9BACI|nr:NAD(P)/FAD-dependent oxidoreductase [Paraliobacillus quinghaiensis]GGM40789.1 ferredoxin--NADP reductase 1 [Paraliobacillus quinghaiensis]
MKEKQELYDVTIIGGGTTGLYATFYSGLRDMKTKLIEASPIFGGKVSLFYPEKLVHEVGAIPAKTGEEIVAETVKQAQTYQPNFVQNEWIEDIEKLNDGTFILTAASGKQHFSKTIILATGTGRFTVRGPECFDLQHDKNVHTSIRDWQQYQDKRVAILTSNRAGIDWSLKIDGSAEKVFLINEKSAFQKAQTTDIERVNQSNVDVRTETLVEEVIREQDLVKEIIVKNKDGVSERIAVDDILVYNGVELQSATFEKWGLNLDKGRIATDTKMHTNIEGVFVAGDAASYPGKMILIAAGYTEAMTAVNSAKKYVDPKASDQVYSTVIYRDKQQ